MDPAERAEYLKTDSSITSAHHDSATSGQSEVFIVKKPFSFSTDILINNIIDSKY